MAERSARVPRWVKATLAVSLALNLVVVGLVVGASLSRGGPPWHPAARAPVDPGGLIRALPDDAREDVIRAMREGREREDRAERDRRTRAILALIRSEPFDRARLEAALDERRAATSSEFDRIQSLFLDRLEGMDAAERSAFADRLTDRGSWRGDREGRRD